MKITVRRFDALHKFPRLPVSTLLLFLYLGHYSMQDTVQVMLWRVIIMPSFEVSVMVEWIRALPKGKRPTLLLDATY